MTGFVLHPDALTDLTEIWEYIAADNPSAADRVLDEIEEAVRALVPFPQMGHPRADLTSRPLRFQLVRDFLIAYAPDAQWPLWRAWNGSGNTRLSHNIQADIIVRQHR